MSNKLLVIAGPTAVGKTALSIEIASKYHTEILSADSRQFYREMSIGTAKPSIDELNACKHHFIGHVSVKQNYTASNFETEAFELLVQLFEKHKILLLSGGSGLYIDALCNGFDEVPASNIEIREQLKDLYQKEGIKALQHLLIKYDASYAAKIDMNNPHRLIRAIEINLISGMNVGEFYKKNNKQRPFDIIKVCLTMDRKRLYTRINNRVDEMIEKGLEDEALSLYHLKHINALQTVGYKEFFDYFEGKTDYNEAVEKIKQNTRNYAKRQLTWFRRDKAYYWFDIDTEKEELMQFIESKIRS